MEVQSANMADGSGCTYLKSISLYECGDRSGNSDGWSVFMFCTTFSDIQRRP